MSLDVNAVHRCWSSICSALGADIGLKTLPNGTFGLGGECVVNLHFRPDLEGFPQLCLALKPVQVCTSKQVTLILVGGADLVVLVSCDLSTFVLSIHFVDASAVSGGMLREHNIPSRFTANSSLYQIYGFIKSAVRRAMYLNGGVWSPLSTN